MKINYKLISAVLATGIAYDAYCLYESQKRFDKLKTLTNHAMTLNKIFAKKLADNDIPLDEFEEIVLQDILSEL